jgi:hypothetical protein
MPRRCWWVAPFVALVLTPSPSSARGSDVAIQLGVTPRAADYPGGLLLGMLLGHRPWDVVGLGTNLQWRSAFRRDLLVPGSARLPGGPSVRADRLVPNGQLDLFPLYAHLYACTGLGPFRGMVGAGGGYQVGFVKGDRFATETLGGWGGTVWLVAHRPLHGGNTGSERRLGVYIAYDLGSVRRDRYDSALGAEVRQKLDVSAFSVAISASVSFER